MTDDSRNIYNNIPHRGQPFKEGRFEYYWNISRAPVGTTYDSWGKGGLRDIVKLSQTTASAKEPWVRTNVIAVENGNVNGHPLTKWKLLPDHGEILLFEGILGPRLN